eukprot:Gb_39363 [translate_table: standard]
MASNNFSDTFSSPFEDSTSHNMARLYLVEEQTDRDIPSINWWRLLFIFLHPWSGQSDPWVIQRKVPQGSSRGSKSVQGKGGTHNATKVFLKHVHQDSEKEKAKDHHKVMSVLKGISSVTQPRITHGYQEVVVSQEGAPPPQKCSFNLDHQGSQINGWRLLFIFWHPSSGQSDPWVIQRKVPQDSEEEKAKDHHEVMSVLEGISSLTQPRSTHGYQEVVVSQEGAPPPQKCSFNLDHQGSQIKGRAMSDGVAFMTP